MRLVSRIRAARARRREGASFTFDAARSGHGGLMPAGAGIVGGLLAACLICLPCGALAQQGVQSPKFDVSGFRVEGNSVLSAAEIDATLQPYVGKQRDRDWLIRHFKNPQAVVPGSAMPPFDLDPESLNTLADYLLTLK